MIQAFPEVGYIRPMRSFRVVVFPAPFGPRKPRISPALPQVRPFRASTSAFKAGDKHLAGFPATINHLSEDTQFLGQLRALTNSPVYNSACRLVLHDVFSSPPIQAHPGFGRCPGLWPEEINRGLQRLSELGLLHYPGQDASRLFILRVVINLMKLEHRRVRPAQSLEGQQRRKSAAQFWYLYLAAFYSPSENMY
jgi:hypothetical protein